jgi:hypothetical protein
LFGDHFLARAKEILVDEIISVPQRNAACARGG